MSSWEETLGIPAHDKGEFSDAQEYFWDNSERYKEIQHTIVDYDEGNITYEYIYHDKDADKYFCLLTTSNSWEDYSEDDVIYEVVPEQVTVTQYKKKVT